MAAGNLGQKTVSTLDTFGRAFLSTSPSLRLETPKHIVKLMSRTITQIRRGSLDVKAGIVISRLAWVALEAMKYVGNVNDIKTIGGGRYHVRKIIEIEPEPSNAAHTFNQPESIGLKAGSAGGSDSITNNLPELSRGISGK